MGFFWFVSSPLSLLFAVYERQGTNLLIQIFIFISRLISLYIGGVYQNIYLALGLFSMTGIIAYGAYAIINIKLANASLRKLFHIFIKYFISYLPACVCLFFIKYIMQSDRVILLIVALCLGIFYFILSRRKYLSLLS